MVLGLLKTLVKTYFLRQIKIQRRKCKHVAMVTVVYFCVLHGILIILLQTYIVRKDVMSILLTIDSIVSILGLDQKANKFNLYSVQPVSWREADMKD